MADNTTLDPGTGGDAIRDKDRAGVKTQIVGLDLGIGTGTESLMAGAMPVTDNSGSLTVDAPVGTPVFVRLSDGTAAIATLPVSAASLPLPSGASTSAKQPALGTAGTASADVISVQGIASMTPLKVDGSAVTQPVSDGGGSLTVDNAGTFAVQADTELTTADLDTGAGTDTRAVVGLALAASGGAVLVGSANPVPISDNSGSITVDNAGTFAVQIAANSSINNAQVAGTAVSVNSGTKDAGTQRVILASDQTVVPVSDNSGSLTVDAPVGTPVFATATPSTTGGWSKIKYAAQTTTVQTPKGTAGTFGGYYVYNPNTSVAYVQVFDAATATTITLGTTVPDMIFAIPASSAANLEIVNGVNMANGIKLACTTTATGSTAPTSGLDMTVFYK